MCCHIWYLLCTTADGAELDRHLLSNCCLETIFFSTVRSFGCVYYFMNFPCPSKIRYPKCICSPSKETTGGELPMATDKVNHNNTIPCRCFGRNSCFFFFKSNHMEAVLFLQNYFSGAEVKAKSQIRMLLLSVTLKVSEKGKRKLV